MGFAHNGPSARRLSAPLGEQERAGEQSSLAVAWLLSSAACTDGNPSAESALCAAPCSCGKDSRKLKHKSTSETLLPPPKIIPLVWQRGLISTTPQHWHTWSSKSIFFLLVGNCFHIFTHPHPSPPWLLGPSRLQPKNTTTDMQNVPGSLQADRGISSLLFIPVFRSRSRETISVTLAHQFLPYPNNSFPRTAMLRLDLGLSKDNIATSERQQEKANP